jgi:hypothetical protein
VARKTGKLTRAQQEEIVDGLSAGDVIRVTGTEGNPSEKAEAIFNRGAERQGFGAEALDRVPIADTAYLSELLSEALNMGGPKADDTSQSPSSADTGDSAQS